MKTFEELIKNGRIKLEDKNLKFDEYENNKINWLNDDENNGYIAEKTKITYYRLLDVHVHSSEIANNKDLRKFTSVEIENLVKGAITNSSTTKRAIFAAINNYMIYNVERGFISYNPCDSIPTTDLFEVNNKALKEQYMPLDEFYEYVDVLSADDVEKMVYVLIRYGVPVSDVPNVKWEDLNEEEMILTTTVKKKVVSLPIDKEFIRRVKLCKACSDYEDGDYMIKTMSGIPSSVSRIYGIIDRVSKASEVARPDMGMLFKNRRYDLALEIYEDEGQIESSDLKEILDTLGLSSGNSSLTTFRKELENIFGLEVKTKNKRAIDVIDINTGEIIKTYESIRNVVKDSKETFGFYIDKSVVGKTCKGEREGMRGLTFRYSEQG